MPDPTPTGNDRPSVSSQKPSGRPALEAEVERMQARLAEFQRLHAVARWQAVVLIVIIAAMFFVFSTRTVARVKANFTDDQVRQAMANRAPEIVATVTPPLARAVQASVPTYRETAVRRLKEVGPEIAAAAHARMERIPEEQGQMIEKHVQKTLDSALARVERDIAKEFPHLTDDQRRSALAAFNHDRVEQSNKELATQLNGMVTKEVVRFDAVVQRLGVQDAGEKATQDPGTAERAFLHNAIMLIDDNVMSDEGGVYLPGLVAAMPAKGATTRPVATTGPTAAADQPPATAASAK